jgi:hypothetical protein
MIRLHFNPSPCGAGGVHAPLLAAAVLAAGLCCVCLAAQAAPLPDAGGTLLILRSAVRPEVSAAGLNSAEQPPPDDRPIDQMNINVQVTGEVPPSAAQQYFSDSAVSGAWSGRGWSQSCYQWEASALYHNPLYFEDVPLERYGHSLPPPFQPLLSGAKFFGTIPFLSYKMVLEPMNEHIYALGYYRPGNPAPWLWYPIPIRYDATAVEAGIVLGLIFVLPFP